MCVLLGTTGLAWVAVTALQGSPAADGRTLMMVCTACGGVCTGASCDKCTCLMALSDCDTAGPGLACDEYYGTVPLIAVDGDSERNLCGTGDLYCGLPAQ